MDGRAVEEGQGKDASEPFLRIVDVIVVFIARDSTPGVVTDEQVSGQTSKDQVAVRTCDAARVQRGLSEFRPAVFQRMVSW
jgi:hypothetical protein